MSEKQNPKLDPSRTKPGRPKNDSQERQPADPKDEKIRKLEKQLILWRTAAIILLVVTLIVLALKIGMPGKV